MKVSRQKKAQTTRIRRSDESNRREDHEILSIQSYTPLCLPVCTDLFLPACRPNLREYWATYQCSCGEAGESRFQRENDNLYYCFATGTIRTIFSMYYINETNSG